MTSTHKAPKTITAFLSLVFILPAIFIFAIWMNVFSRDLTPRQKIDSFTSSFPSFISDYKMIMLVSMTFCVIAMVLAAKSFKQRQLWLRIAMWLTVMVAALIFMVDLFQLFN